MRRALVVLSAVALLALTLGAAGCGGDDDGDGDEAAATTATPAETGETEATETTDSGGGPAGGCRDVAEPEARPEGQLKAPTALLNVDQTYEVLVETSCGEFTITLDPKASPKTTASFVALVQDGFFDGTVFHRIVPGFVIQGGDPTATGGGGPGYSTVDKPGPQTRYTKGVVAMAKTAAEAPGTSGSQFFVVTADDAGLPPDYAVIGTVTDGLDVVERIGVLGDPNTQLPTQPVVVARMTVRIT
jgi:cyclophilin family peptidyl-prolyl cis-trans isomerase